MPDSSPSPRDQLAAEFDRRLAEITASIPTKLRRPSEEDLRRRFEKRVRTGKPILVASFLFWCLGTVLLIGIVLDEHLFYSKLQQSLEWSMGEPYRDADLIWPIIALSSYSAIISASLALANPYALSKQYRLMGFVPIWVCLLIISVAMAVVPL